MIEKIVTLGPKFSYSYNVAKKYFRTKEIILMDNINDVFEEVVSDDSIRGIVPVENMLNGSVRETFISLQEGNIKIFKAFDFKIEHILAGKSSNFTKILSHPQALSQCYKFIRGLRKCGIEIGEVASSSVAMEMAGKDKKVAAIGNEEAGRYYGLSILRRNIANSNNNKTRFFEVGIGELQTEGDKTSLIIIPDVDRSGLLFEILAVFKIKELNLSKIESLPTGEGINNYMFYIDIESSLNHSRLREAIEFLRTFVKVRVLGSYEVVY